ncbi:hypothetical protein TNCV_1691261 [Trichonephila clavipes]|nr:hypothetical protein TNCV_1691261 [Trichonephila clavipes]
MESQELAIAILGRNFSRLAMGLSFECGYLTSLSLSHLDFVQTVGTMECVTSPHACCPLSWLGFCPAVEVFAILASICLTEYYFSFLLEVVSPSFQSHLESDRICAPLQDNVVVKIS